MKVLKASTKAGENILRRAEYNEGYFLSATIFLYNEETDKLKILKEGK